MSSVAKRQLQNMQVMLTLAIFGTFLPFFGPLHLASKAISEAIIAPFPGPFLKPFPKPFSKAFPEAFPKVISKPFPETKMLKK